MNNDGELLGIDGIARHGNWKKQSYRQANVFDGFVGEIGLPKDTVDPRDGKIRIKTNGSGARCG